MTLDKPGMKPDITYQALIGMSILQAPDRRLTVAQICQWISDTFEFYRYSNKSWHRHISTNLYIHQQFIKQERPSGDPGNGFYWTIKAGAEHLFLDQASRVRSDTDMETAKLHRPIMHTEVLEFMYECTGCTLKFDSSPSLKQHNISVHGYKRIDWQWIKQGLCDRAGLNGFVRPKY